MALANVGVDCAAALRSGVWPARRAQDWVALWPGESGIVVALRSAGPSRRLGDLSNRACGHRTNEDGHSTGNCNI